jgi:hypothetical protein
MKICGFVGGEDDETLQVPSREVKEPSPDGAEAWSSR